MGASTCVGWTCSLSSAYFGLSGVLRQPRLRPAVPTVPNWFTAVSQGNRVDTDQYHEVLDKLGDRHDTLLSCPSHCDRRDLWLCICASRWDGYGVPQLRDGYDVASRNGHLRGHVCTNGNSHGGRPTRNAGCESAPDRWGVFANQCGRGKRDELDRAFQWWWRRSYWHDTARNNRHGLDVEQYGPIHQYVWPSSRSRQHDVFAVERLDF
jgi:hypothetical protein